jgi:hypothetical protein
MDGRGYVAFRIPAEGPYVFDVLSNLPWLSNSSGVVLDGADQAASGLGSGPQEIILQAAGASTGIVSNGPNSLVANLQILEMSRGVILYQQTVMENVDVLSTAGDYGISVDGDGSILRDVASQGFSYGMTIYGDGVQLFDGDVDARSYGINISSDGFLVEDTEINSPNFTFNLSGERATLRRVTMRDSIFRMNISSAAHETTVEECDLGDGRILAGSNFNRVTGSTFAQVSFDGDDNVAIGNTVHSTGSYDGFYVSGERNTLSKNVATALPSFRRLIRLTGGGNASKSVPTLDAVSCSGSTMTVTGMAEPGDTVELFMTSTSGGFAESLGGSVVAAADGSFAVDYVTAGIPTDAHYFNATATDTSGNTSEHASTVTLSCL